MIISIMKEFAMQIAVTGSIAACGVAWAVLKNRRRGPPPLPVFTADGTVFVRGGTFLMGRNTGGHRGEKPMHKVTVSSFYMGRFPVTQQEWYEVLGKPLREQSGRRDTQAGIKGEGGSYPIYYLSWNDAVKYCNALSEKAGLTEAYKVKGVDDEDTWCRWKASGYRLPTEAEWEYAAKGGSGWHKAAYEYAGDDDPLKVAWFKDNTEVINAEGKKELQARPVGMKKPNSLGIYDMSGNVYEWCWDWLGSYPRLPWARTQRNPKGHWSGVFRVTRGGCYNSQSWRLTTTDRCGGTPHTNNMYNGMRVVRGAANAVKDCVEALAKEPADPANAHNNLGAAYYYEGKYEKAIAEFNKVAAANAAHVLLAQTNLGVVYHTRGKKGDDNGARTHFQAALRFTPNNGIEEKALELARQMLNITENNTKAIEDNQ